MFTRIQTGDIGFCVNEASKQRDNALLDRARTIWKNQDGQTRGETSRKRVAATPTEGSRIAVVVCPVVVCGTFVLQTSRTGRSHVRSSRGARARERAVLNQSPGVGKAAITPTGLVALGDRTKYAPSALPVAWTFRVLQLVHAGLSSLRQTCGMARGSFTLHTGSFHLWRQLLCLFISCLCKESGNCHTGAARREAIENLLTRLSMDRTT